MFLLSQENVTLFRPSPVVVSGWVLCSEAIIAGKLHPILFTDHPSGRRKVETHGFEQLTWLKADLDESGPKHMFLMLNYTFSYLEIYFKEHNLVLLILNFFPFLKILFIY